MFWDFLSEFLVGGCVIYPHKITDIHQREPMSINCLGGQTDVSTNKNLYHFNTFSVYQNIYKTFIPWIKQNKSQGVCKSIILVF